MKRALAGAVFLVVGLWPGAAQAETRWGAAAFTGTMSYQGDGIPVGLRQTGTVPACRKTFFDVSLTTVANVEHEGRAFRGPITVVGGGGNGLWPDSFECESLALGVGFWHLSVPLVTDSFGATLRCEQFTGVWSRYGSALASVLDDGTCEIDGIPIGDVSFIVAGTWTPTAISPAPSTTTVANVTEARLTGVIQIDDETLG